MPFDSAGFPHSYRATLRATRLVDWGRHAQWLLDSAGDGAGSFAHDERELLEFVEVDLAVEVGVELEDDRRDLAVGLDPAHLHGLGDEPG